MPEISHVDTVLRPKFILHVPIRVPDLGVVEDSRVMINAIYHLFCEYETRKTTIDYRPLQSFAKAGTIHLRKQILSSTHPQILINLAGR